jgi:hypothetical protein
MKIIATLARSLDEAGCHDLADRMDRLAQSDDDALARWHAKDAEREAARERFYTETYPTIVARMLISGLGPEEIARRTHESIGAVMRAIERCREIDPGFDRRIVDEMAEHERKLRSADLSPSVYDAVEGLLRTDDREYARARDDYGRIVPHHDLMETGGMELPVDMGRIDPSLAGWFGAHTGDPEGWFPILVRDQFVGSPAHQYSISADDVPLFEMRDPHPIDREEVPDSQIVFTHPSLLPGGRPFIPPSALSHGGEMNIEDYPDEGDEFGDEDDEV